jgi:flagellar hook-length control protein FliK
MQADLLIGFNQVHKKVWENHFTLKSTCKSSFSKDDISSIDPEGKSFFEFFSIFIEDESTESSEAEQVKQAFQKLIIEGKHIESSEAEQVKQAFQKLIIEDKHIESSKAEQVKLAPQKLINEAEPTDVLSELLPLFNSMESTVDQTGLKERLEALILLFKRMSLSESSSLVHDKEGETEFLRNYGKPLEVCSGISGNLILEDVSENEKQHLCNIDRRSQADIIRQSQIEFDDQKLKSDNQYRAIVENQNLSGSKDQKNSFEMKEITGKYADNSKSFQLTATEKVEISIPKERIHQNDSENRKETLQALNNMGQQKGTPDSNQLSNISTVSSQMNKSISMETDELEVKKSYLELKYVNDRIVNINKEGDSKSAMDSNGKSDNSNAKFETLIEENNLNNEGSLKVKFSSDRVSSIVNEAKILPKIQRSNQNSIIKQIVEKINLSPNKEHDKITIKLKPEFLGNIRLNISSENHHVTIKVMADSSMVKEILESNLHHLKNGFVNQGLEIGSFDVMVSDEPENSFKEHNFSGFQRGRRRVAGQKKFSLNSTEEEEVIDPVLPDHTRTDNDRIDYYV